MDADRSDRRIGVFLLDDHEVVRRGIRALLDREPDLEVVGEAATADEAIRRIPATRPDVALLDVGLPDSSGIEVCREVRSRHPEVRCLMLTSYSDEQALLDAIIAGAAGYVLKRIRGADLADAVRQVAAGASLIDPALTGAVLARIRHPESYRDPLDDLTPHERRVLELVAEAQTNRQIAEHLGVSEKSVKHAVSSLLAKLGMERRTEAAVLLARATAAHRLG